jgi:hypothetical protein
MVMIELELVRIRKDIEHLNEYYEKAGSWNFPRMEQKEGI